MKKLCKRFQSNKSGFSYFFFLGKKEGSLGIGEKNKITKSCEVEFYEYSGTRARPPFFRKVVHLREMNYDFLAINNFERV